MTFPALHLNGTGAQDLLEGYEKAHEAVREALQALAQTAPNGRDYYVQKPEAWPMAVEEHMLRMAKLVEVSEALEALAEHVSVEDMRRRERKGGN